MLKTIPYITLGLDPADKKHEIRVLNAEGAIIDERHITHHRESPRRLSLKHPGSRIARGGGA